MRETRVWTEANKRELAVGNISFCAGLKFCRAALSRLEAARRRKKFEPVFAALPADCSAPAPVSVSGPQLFFHRLRRIWPRNG